MPVERVLVIDDELLVRSFLTETLQRKNLEVTSAESGQKALAILKDNSFDLVICDMKMPGYTGIDVLRKIKATTPETIVVVITAFGSVENAVEAMRLGAFNYLIKPFAPDNIETIIAKANEHLALLAENNYLRQQVSSGGQQSPYTIIGKSPAIKQIINDIARVAKSHAAVFITGESGTGKEVVAHTIHFNSLRANGPFIKVNCAAIPENLIESEFFGHEKGAFTGADTKRLGRFELAHAGTLLLDEITETPLALQAKLLRVTQQQEFERVGGTKSVKVDVRLIATSNRNIKEAIQQKALREDLYYRLNVIPIHIPPLRERREDIIPITEHLLERLAKEHHKSKKQLTEDAKQILLKYDWPGNVRELANIIERAVVLDLDTVISTEHLYIDTPPNARTPPSPLSTGKTLQEMERDFIIETLHMQKNDRKRAAEQLGITVRSLANKIKGIDLE